jgi:hypothetical protein
MVAHKEFLFKKRVISRELMFCNGSDIFNMTIHCLFFLFCCLVIKDAKSLALE